MKTNAQTLEEFIEAYVRNKVKANPMKSYTDWVMQSGVDSGKIHTDAVRGLTLNYNASRGEYGAEAEGLYGMGLAASGYSDYITERARTDMKQGFKKAEDDYIENEKKNMRGFAAALEKENRKFTSTVKAIEGAGLVDFDSAYEYAVNAGFTGEDARAVAAAGSGIVRKKLKNTVMRAVVSKSLTKSQTRDYALSLGLCKEDADELSEYADDINAYISSSDYTSGYLDYLINKD